MPPAGFAALRPPAAHPGGRALRGWGCGLCGVGGGV